MKGGGDSGCGRAGGGKEPPGDGGFRRSGYIIARRSGHTLLGSGQGETWPLLCTEARLPGASESQSGTSLSKAVVSNIVLVT